MNVKGIICEKLTDDPDIDASEISVDVTSQVVKLTGTVDDRSTKYEVEELIERCGRCEGHRQSATRALWFVAEARSCAHKADRWRRQERMAPGRASLLRNRPRRDRRL